MNAPLCYAAVALMAWTAGCGDAKGGSEVAAASSPQEPHEKSEEWLMTYIDASASDIRAEISTLMDVLEADTGEYFDSQFESGAYIVEGPYTPGEPFTLDTSGDDLSEFRFLPNRQVGKVILPESEYPQQYEMHRKIKWLMAFEATKK